MPKIAFQTAQNQKFLAYLTTLTIFSATTFIILYFIKHLKISCFIIYYVMKYKKKLIKYNAYISQL